MEILLREFMRMGVAYSIDMIRKLDKQLIGCGSNINTSKEGERYGFNRELLGLYNSYYNTECTGVRDLGRMRVLENKATKLQLIKLLNVFGVSYDEVFE